MDSDQRVLLINPRDPDPAMLARAGHLLRTGHLVAFPTETVYGLGADALNPQAIIEIFRAKGRPAHNPLIAHVSQPIEAQRLAATWPETASRLAERFWPGPLTLVLPAQEHVPRELTAGGSTVAIRCPAHPVALGVIQAAGTPIAAPSANLSGEISPTTAAHVLKGLADRIDLILDGGPTPGGIESTVIDLSHDRPRLLRPGLVSIRELNDVIGDVLIFQQNHDPLGIPLPSPGMMLRHYAPRTPTETYESAADALDRHATISRQGEQVVLVMFGPHPDAPENAIILPGDPTQAASQLYATLHDLDARNHDRIVIAMPPDTSEWQAIRDRLRRASAD